MKKQNFWKSFFYFWILVLFFVSNESFAWQNEFRKQLHNGGALAVSHDGRILFSHRADDPFVPASTIKVATAAFALKELGRDFHFPTDFYWNRSSADLTIKGYGDPGLTSEELHLIADKLILKGMVRIKNVYIDDSFFAPSVALDGAGKTGNPYDAGYSSFAANYNTIYVTKKAGMIRSAEAQTPLTPTALAYAKKYVINGIHRINLGQDQKRLTQNAAELLVEILKQKGVPVTGAIQHGRPSAPQPFYRHLSSKSLEDLVRDLLEYSNNFITNQLFLVLGAKKYGAPANPEKAQMALSEFLKHQVQWNDFSIGDGAGLSRQNKVSPIQMVQLLDYFLPYRDLLPYKQGINSKTGTLNGVNTLVGLIDTPDYGAVRFAILVNSPVGFHHKFMLGKKLTQALGGQLHPERSRRH